MRLVTWNINSVRLRIGLVGKLIDEQKPDVICLQETKTQDETFPHEAFAAKGYAHRHITEIHCCYVPAGGDIPDPVANVKFAHKLGFMDEQAAWWAKADKKKSRILVGDLNVAPLEHDVWSHKQMLDVVSHTPIEVEKFSRWQGAHKWVDAVRYFVPEDKKLYSWWSYRAADWVASDRGRRLDHVWVTPDLAPSLKAAHILRDARGWEPKPSDHVPVIVDIS